MRDLRGQPALVLAERVPMTGTGLVRPVGEGNRCTCSLAKSYGSWKLLALFPVLPGPGDELFGHKSMSCLQRTWRR